MFGEVAYFLKGDQLSNMPELELDFWSKKQLSSQPTIFYCTVTN